VVARSGKILLVVLLEVWFGPFLAASLTASAVLRSGPEPLVAVCCGTTTRKVTGPTISKLALFRYLLPSMAHTLDCGHRYAAVVGYDKGDPFYDSLHGMLQVGNATQITYCWAHATCRPTSTSAHPLRMPTGANLTWLGASGGEVVRGGSRGAAEDPGCEHDA